MSVELAVGGVTSTDLCQIQAFDVDFPTLATFTEAFVSIRRSALAPFGCGFRGVAFLAGIVALLWVASAGRRVSRAFARVAHGRLVEESRLQRKTTLFRTVIHEATPMVKPFHEVYWD